MHLMKEIGARDGLAQNITFKDVCKTNMVLINTILRIGKEDGMCTDHIREDNFRRNWNT